ncbi:MAG: hypothetical protein GY796_14430 [Chloroflexi bacterium]|nr:hypothetical protein [Chloroflexota bacterium]
MSNEIEQPNFGTRIFIIPLVAIIIVVGFTLIIMAAADVTCRDCHEVDADYPGAVEHEDTYVLNTPTTATCESCHENEVAQYNRNRL